VYAARFKITEMPEEELYMPRDRVGGPLMCRFCKVSRRAMAKERARMHPEIQFGLQMQYFTP
jgi:hypothetical protein